ncbi:unnamed protein product [Hymenolepis diminuta]|uniref:Uncharacterized protein n=1 Tax=Hymenolepis diminuta TaxID=6216 RepID=A0A564YYM2_HYMDI|nr:unnamed protein product [Hymenolepis diminuta]
MSWVKHAYLDRRVTENASPVFPSNPPVKETEKSTPVTRNRRHVVFPDRYKA